MHLQPTFGTKKEGGGKKKNVRCPHSDFAPLTPGSLRKEREGTEQGLNAAMLGRKKKQKKKKGGGGKSPARGKRARGRVITKKKSKEGE